MKSRWARSARASGLLRGRRASRPISSSAAAARRAQRVDLAVQPGQSLAAVGGGAHAARRPGAPPRPRPPRPYAGRSPPASSAARCVVDLGADRAAPARGPARPRPRAGRGRGPARRARPPPTRRCAPARRPATGCRGAARAARTRANQVSWACASAGRSSRSAASSAVSRSRALASCGLDLLAALDQDRLVGHLLLERRPRRDQVVGQQPGAGVAHVGLHGRRPGGPPRPGGPAA